MHSYKSAYTDLNQAQRQAVDQTEGPVLVIAGPGTGKTQLLSTRIAHILATTDTLPQNILCLTFTEAAAATMRQRLSQMIGAGAYDVTISTYHAFGNDILQRYPEFFIDSVALQPADDLRIDQTLRAVQASLPYSNGLKHDIFLRDIKSILSDYKRALLAPDTVLTIIGSNEDFIDDASRLVREHIGSMPRITKASIAAYGELLIAGQQLPQPADMPVESLWTLWQTSLAEAVASAQTTGKTPALTKWKDHWLVKDGEGFFTVAGREMLRKQRSAIDIYRRYLTALTAQGLYDYDDMILRAIDGLRNNTDLRYSLQERYQYLLLDEFQDTNQAQLQLMYLLTDNPVNEDRPNVLAVGDDDQAIYAFQGANYSHMLDFYTHYNNVLVVPLTENYRSGADILQLGEAVSEQINERLHHNFTAITKTLVATRSSPTDIRRLEFTSDVSQQAWIATEVKRLIDGGMSASEIAIIAPKHKFLEPIVPFLRHQGVAMRYDKREDILSDPAIAELLTMSRLVVALQNQDSEAAATFWPQVLSLAFWQLPTSTIWQAAWDAHTTDWLPVLLNDSQLRPIGLFFIQLSLQSGHEPLETMLDYLSGVTAVTLHEPALETYRSPYYEYYFGDTIAADEPVNFWQLLANLTLLRQRLREYQNNDDSSPTLPDFLLFVAAHQAAAIKILNTNPYQEAKQAVHLLTAFKAKGMEFEAVFIVALHDEVWGSRARNQASRIAIPDNLRFIRYAGASQDERLRLLFVAITRAKSRLYLLGYAADFGGTRYSPVKYLFGTAYAESETIDVVPPSIDDLSAYWHQRHQQSSTNPTLRALLANRLQGFQLSATQVTRFTDTSHDGPTSFLMRDLLKFPSGSSLFGIYGDCIHETLSWLQNQVCAGNPLPNTSQTITQFKTTLRSKPLDATDYEQLYERGVICLEAYQAQRAEHITSSDRSEYNFRNEGVFIGKAHLSGKIDRLRINDVEKTITVVDFKTGRSHSRWTTELKMLHYKQQLYFYKLLVEGSVQYRGYQVTDAYLEFVEPDEQGLIQELHVRWDEQEFADFKLLVQAVWQHIMDLDFPDVSRYGSDTKGSIQFQADLRDT